MASGLMAPKQCLTLLPPPPLPPHQVNSSETLIQELVMALFEASEMALQVARLMTPLITFLMTEYVTLLSRLQMTLL